MADNTSMISGLFQDPLLYQQAQDQAALQRFTQLAQLDPLQQAQASLMYGGYQAGGALGRALGGEDPMLQQLSMRNQLASQFDTSSAEGLINLSNALRQKGDLAGASQVAQQALLAREKEANIQAKTAERLTPEQRNSAAYADTVAERGTPKWTEAYQSKLGELTTKEGKQPEIAQLQSYRDNLVKTYGENDPRVKQVDAAIAKVTKSKMSLEEAKFKLAQKRAEHDMLMELRREDFRERQITIEHDLNNNTATEHWMKSYWRPAMGWLYMAICAFDFIVGPILSLTMPAVLSSIGVESVTYTPWESLTLSNGGLIHLAFGAILGVTAWTRGVEKIQSSKQYQT